MKRTFTLFLLLSTLVACSPPTNVVVDLGSEPNHRIEDDVLYVYTDPGGKLYKRLNFIAYLERNEMDVHIMGRCVSACTLYLSMENTCVSPQARFGFHGPSVSDAYLTSNQRKTDIELMISYYPDFLDSWFTQKAAHLVGEQLIWLNGTELIRHGVPSCSSISFQRSET